MQQKKTTVWVVGPQESGLKLITFLKSKLDTPSTKSLKRLIENNCCLINGRGERFASTLVGEGDHILLIVKKEIVDHFSLSFELTRLLYEDEELFIYDKPQGIASDSPELLAILRSKQSSLELIHRLDKETTGILMFAKSRLIKERCIALFKSYRVEKCYLALVDGVPSRQSGIIDNFLGRLHSYKGQAIWGEVLSNKGLRAITTWKVEKKGKEVALLRCYPKTGRTHQIRVHLSGMGFPILGDFQYGKKFKSNYQAPRILLHAAEISFPHPITQENVKVMSPFPQDMKEAIETLLRVDSS